MKGRPLSILWSGADANANLEKKTMTDDRNALAAPIKEGADSDLVRIGWRDAGFCC